MPYGVFPVPKLRTTTNADPAWGLRTIARARMQRNRLDAELAAGADPSDSRLLAFRAAQLQTPAAREELARALIAAVTDAEGGAPANVVHPQRGEARACSDQLIALAGRLRSHHPVEVRGAAMVALLVNDRLHRPGNQRLADAAAEAHSALIPAPDVERDLATAA
jgi:hypothetical protein